MSSIPRQLAKFAAVLAGLYIAGFIAGQFIDPKPHGAEDEAQAEPEHGDAADPVRGLAVAEHGVQHTILVRRDLTGFQHLHPTMSDDGTWSTAVQIDEPGSYRLFADFSRGDQPTTLATDLRVDGAANLRPLPAPADEAVSDGGYDVALTAGPTRPGRETQLRFAVAQDRAPVRTEPYLGAGGHLVALREGDLAFLHVHPTDDGYTGPGTITFATTFPTQGRYRLFLQFQHDGRVHTVGFTQEVS